MAKNVNFNDEERVKIPSVNTEVESKEETVKVYSSKHELRNCLQNRRIIVRFISKPTALVQNPKHLLYGGMAENATKTYTVPMLQSGALKNILTDSEKDFLEDCMGLEHNALSIYKKENNFWMNGTEGGVSEVTLKKQDNYLDLSNPIDYIKYKILLANNGIAHSMEEYLRTPKATYEFVIVAEGDEDKIASEETDVTMEAYEALGSILDSVDTMRVVVETLIGKTTSKTVNKNWLKAECGKEIKNNPKKFLQVAKDPSLYEKVLIRKSIDAGLIQNRGGLYYLTENGTPLCDVDEEPNFSIAAKYLSLPKNQQLKFMLEEKTK